jgi:hypothetical protein
MHKVYPIKQAAKIESLCPFHQPLASQALANFSFRQDWLYMLLARIKLAGE